MSALRDEIRAILREELAALRNEVAPAPETVRIETSTDLNRFAQDLLERAQNPDFVAGVRAGTIRFALTGGAVAPSAPARPIVTSPSRPVAELLDKKLVTERDIAELQSRHIRLPRHSRITPLAQDEARRKGIRIERTEP